MSFLHLSRRTSQVFIGRTKAPNPMKALVVLFLWLRLCNSMNNIFLRDILWNTIFFRLNMKFSFCDKEGKGATCIYLVREDNKSVGTLKKFRKRSEQRDLFKRLSRKLYSKFMEQLQLRKRISKQWKRNKCIQSFVLTRTFQKWDFSYLIFRPQEGIWQWSNGRMKQCI